VRALDAHFGEEYFTLSQLFSDEQRRLGRRLLGKALEHLEQHCAEVYQTNQRLTDFLLTTNLPLPDVLRAAVQTTLNAELNEIANRLSTGQVTPGDVAGRIGARQGEAKRLQCPLNFDQLNRAFETLIERHLALLSQDPGHAQIPRQALEVAQELKLRLNLWRGQNLFWRYLTGAPHAVDLPVMLELGTRLGFSPAVVGKLLHGPAAAPHPAHEG
jgi:hypothetical protein